MFYALLITMVCYVLMCMGILFNLITANRSNMSNARYAVSALNLVAGTISTVTCIGIIFLIKNPQLDFIDLFWFMGILAALTLSASSSPKNWKIIAALPGFALLYPFAKTIPVIETAMVLNPTNYIRVLAGYSLIIPLTAGLVVVITASIFSKYTKK